MRSIKKRVHAKVYSRERSPIRSMRPVEILSTLLSSIEMGQEPIVEELVSDVTGMANFVIFRSSKLPNLEVGRSYRVH